MTRVGPSNERAGISAVHPSMRPQRVMPVIRCPSAAYPGAESAQLEG